MLGNFSYSNPTKLYFGDKAVSFLKDELVPRRLLVEPHGIEEIAGCFDQEFIVDVFLIGGASCKDIEDVAGIPRVEHAETVHGADLPCLGREAWQRLVATACRFAGETCRSQENYIKAPSNSSEEGEPIRPI